ncbi:nucleotidyltransferase [Polynucleobacter sp. SHI8]|uniref:nucleotidyl transferase AbiEii/AbiGii toxin family protein n=1 Tax=unclassified Polynucleobacter TaxID=2640945 RepID=UPI0024915DD6|nr:MULTISPECIES: nucleotidyl transferase AbiEii/AbiGii toxin family protein [unclassified Polynucleobacter]BDW10066.1 nucleotidyltransferase [Polynucleobacter sp. SHI2]BDW12512.1 nucleotidyltransferase [Polynucleobacter sp. SHI8]
MTEREDFEKLVDRAMDNPTLTAMRPVVEKELLHYEIFQALDREGLLKDLVFQGGTALRLCRGSDRFSEDLDFAGDIDFSAEKMEKIKDCVEKRIGDRFGLNVAVSPKPAKASVGSVKVDKWWISIETTPENRSMPQQKIKIEIANIPAHTKELLPLLANYDSVRALPTVLVNTESLDEIMADKILAFPTSLINNEGNSVIISDSKIRHRDIWDLAWLARQGAKLNPNLVVVKIGDYGIRDFDRLLGIAIELIPAIVKDRQFKAQMSRFIDSAIVDKMLSTDAHLEYLSNTTKEMFLSIRSELT